MLTTRGWFALATGVILGAAGWAFGYLELIVLALGCLFSVLASCTFLLMRPRVEVWREIHPDRVTAGELALGRVRVRNMSTRRSFGFTAFEQFGGLLVPVPIPKLPPGERKSATYRLPTQRRGVVDVGPMLMGRNDPLGFVAGHQAHGGVVTLWVHPRHYPLKPLPAALTRSLDGPTTDTAPSGTITFHAIREYVMGDDLRHVHWRSTAHTGELMVKHYVDTSLPDTTLLVDTSARSHSRAMVAGVDSFEVALEAAASIVLASTSRHFPLQLHTTGELSHTTRGGGNTAQEFLDQFALLEPDEGDISTILSSLGHARGGTAFVIVTAAPEAADLAAVAVLPRKYSIVALVNVAPDPARPLPAIPGVRIIEAPSGIEFAAIWNRGTRG